MFGIASPARHGPEWNHPAAPPPERWTRACSGNRRQWLANLARHRRLGTFTGRVPETTDFEKSRPTCMSAYLHISPSSNGKCRRRLRLKMAGRGSARSTIAVLGDQNEGL